MVQEEKLDRRVRRTRQQLRDALIALILEKGFDQITVGDIADQANINRATFYLHYRDKEELLLSCMQDVYDDLVKRIEHLSKTQPLAELDLQSDLLVLAHVLEYGPFYRVMLSKQGVAAFLYHILDYIAKVNVENCTALMLDTPVPVEVTAYYYAGAAIGVIYWWVKNDFQVPAEQLARYTTALDHHSSAWALGLPDDMPLGGAL